MALTYTLVRECLNNAEDAGWPLADRGRPGPAGQAAGRQLLQHQRVSCGTRQQNTAQLWLTLFFLKGAPPENMTLHGAHDFNSGGEIGSVSAASTAFAANIGKRFKRVVNTLTIG